MARWRWRWIGVFRTVGVFVALALVGPHARLGNAYAPNLLASLAELTIGAGLVAAFVTWNRKTKLARRTEAAVALLERPNDAPTSRSSKPCMWRLLIDRQIPSHLANPREELIRAWTEALNHLDLTSEPTIDPRHRRWMGVPGIRDETHHD